MYVDIDRLGEVSIAQMTIEEAIFLQQALRFISMNGCCDNCKAKAAEISNRIKGSLNEHALRKANYVEQPGQ